MLENRSKLNKAIRQSANLSDDELSLKVLDSGIDGVCFVIEKSRALKMLRNLELTNKLRLTTRNKAINEYIEHKFNDLHNLTGDARHPFKKRYINFKRGGKSLTNTLIFIENNDDLNKLCMKRKKKFGSYVMIVFAGLYQPSREIKPETLRVLRAFLRRFNTWWIDLAKDFISDESELRKNDFKIACKRVNLGEIYQVGSNENGRGVTLYANKCVGNIKKVLIYDKFAKQSIYHKQALDPCLKNWRRVEMRINIRRRFSKVKRSDIDEYNLILDDIARHYAWRVLFGASIATLEKQLNFFKDGRKIFKSDVKLKEFVA